MEKKRESNFDLLRIICTIAVVFLHVSAAYINASAEPDYFGVGQCYTKYMPVTCFYNAFVRFAVPCFVMLSGAFILADDRNSEYGRFYKKTFRSIGIPTIIFSIGYFLYSMAVIVFKIAALGTGYEDLLNPIRNLIRGVPFYHMWYLYMLIGVYALAPIVIKFKNDIGEKKFEKVAWVFFILSVICINTSSRRMHWDIGYSFSYLGYFMIGYVLRQRGLQRKNNRKACLYIGAGVFVELLIVYFRYQQYMAGIVDDKMKYALITPHALLVVIASILIFSGFSYLELKKDFGKLSSATFLIFLFHAFFWHIGNQIVVRVFGINGDSRMIIPVSVAAVLLLSYIAAVIYKKIWTKIYNGYLQRKSLK